MAKCSKKHKPKPAWLKIGAKVRSDFFLTGIFSDTIDEDSAKIVRKVTAFERDPKCYSGWRVCADAGKCCKSCQRPFTQSIDGADANWFKPLKFKKAKK